jgi:antitoxin (DNA-binding transcriptional repressor) of toxin-antitoxin stability system
MRRLELEEATSPLVDYERQLKDGPLVLTVDGHPVAALVPIEAADWESLSLSTNPDFIALIEQSRARFRTEGGISSEEIRREFGLQNNKPRQRQPAPPDKPASQERK